MYVIFIIYSFYIFINSIVFHHKAIKYTENTKTMLLSKAYAKLFLSILIYP